MDTEFGKKLVEALELVAQTSAEAWWHGKGQHCGCDFNRITCEPCFAFEQCKRNEKLIELFKEFITAVA